MDRNEALSLLKEHVTTESLLGHCIATAAVMKGLAKELGEDENLYELIGILHDIDFQEIDEDMELTLDEMDEAEEVVEAADDVEGIDEVEEPVEE